MDRDDLGEAQRRLKETAAHLQKVAGDLAQSEEVARAKVQATEALRSLGVAARLAARVASKGLRSATAGRTAGPAPGPAEGATAAPAEGAPPQGPDRN